MINNYSYQHDSYVMHALRGDAIGGYVKWQQAYLLFCYASTHTTKTSILQKQHSQFVYTYSKGYLNSSDSYPTEHIKYHYYYTKHVHMSILTYHLDRVVTEIEVGEGVVGP